MVFKITSSASDSLSTLGSVVLLISFEDQILLDSIPGWEPDFSEEKGIVQNSLPLKRKSAPSVHFKLSKEVNEQPAVANGLHIERVRRKILVDDVVDVVPRKDVSGGVSEKHVSSVESQPYSSRTIDEDGLSKRPHSLPDFRNYTVEDNSIESVLPHNGKESVAKEDCRLKSLASVSCKSLQKNSPVSRSLNSISSAQNLTTFFTGKSDAQTDFMADLRNRAIEPHNPKLATEISKNGPVKKSDIVSTKRSCVRRLNLDDGIFLSQGSVVVEKNKLQPSVERQTASLGSRERHAPEKVVSKLALKKRQSGPPKVSQHSNKNLPTGLHKSKEDTVSNFVGCNQPRSTSGMPKDFPECSQQYRIGPETQRALISNFEDDSFCISERPKDDSNDHDTILKNANAGVTSDMSKHKTPEINHEADNLQTSEELFSGSQSSVHGDLSEREKTGQQNDLGGSHRAESIYYNLKHLSTLATVAQSKFRITPQGLRFTKSQIKSMCNVISQLYGSSQ